MSISDHFMRMLALMAIALGKLIGLKQAGNIEGAIEYINEILQDELKINLKHLLKLNEVETLDLLQKKSYHTAEIEAFSKILIELVDTVADKDEKLNLLNKSYYLINWVISNDKTYSIERKKILAQIEKQREILN